MLNTYLKIAQHLKDRLPEIQWIDRDKNQIGNEQQYHTISTPAILLDFQEVQWQGTGRGNQLGEGPLVVKLIFTMPGETYAREANPLQDYEPFATIAQQLHETISKLKEVKERRKAIDYFTTYWYVIEQYYDIEYPHEAPVKMLPKPDLLLTTTVNLPIQ